MSETINIGGVSFEIYGTFTAAKNYASIMHGANYAAWSAASDLIKQKTLVNARRYIDSFEWSDASDTFAERDALTAFVDASYELAVMILEDSTMTQNADASSNIASLGAGSAQVSFFAPTSIQAGTATKLPPLIDRLIGQYLASEAALEAIAGFGQSGDCESKFSECSDYDREEPF